MQEQKSDLGEIEMMKAETDRFEFDYVEPADANAFTMHFHFEDNWIRATVSDKTGLYGDHELVVRGERPDVTLRTK